MQFIRRTLSLLFIGLASIPLLADEPQYVPVNLALNKPTKASSEESGKSHFARLAVDGQKSTRWCANGPQANEWLQIDLERPTKINGIGLTWEGEGAVYRYKVEGSVNGTDWRMLVDQTKNEGKTYEHEFVAKDVRFVKVTYLGSNTGAWGSLWEVGVFGDEKVKVDPAAAKAEAERSKLADLQIPDGFEATLFAAPPAVNYPTFVAAAADGTVYVSVDKNGSLDRQPNRGSVVRLRDMDGDGRADESKLFVADVDSPRGLVWDHDRLYLMHPPHLSAFIDKDGDGISDEQKILVKNIAFGFKDRPADHTSNGVTLGIDGWLYLAIGDFGFVEAEGTDGRKLQLRGGGVVRVRPDGTGLELYSNGTRNILEVALDPLLNGFTRDNTNDGGGWDIRLHHITGLEDHGYPRLYMNFNNEIIQPLADYGGGSGCGALFLDEPGFPKGFSPALYTADWGRSIVYRHQLTPHGATFKLDQSQFLGINRVTDLDVDANSNIYAASWKGATFTYAGEDVGYLVRVRPKGLKPDPLPNFAKATIVELVELLNSPSHRRRLEAQRALLRIGKVGFAGETIPRLLRTATNGELLASRVAAIFTLKQGLGVDSHPLLVGLCEDAAVRPFAIRALADRGREVTDVPVEPLITGMVDANPRVRLESAIALARIGRADRADAVAQLVDDIDPVVAHTAVQSLIRLKSFETCFAILDRANTVGPRRLALLRVLQSIHEPKVVDGLIARVRGEADNARRRDLLVALCRLHFVEGVWKGNSWGTRPDTRGPYFQPETWSESDKIAAVLLAELDKADADGTQFLATQLARHRIELKDGLKSLLARVKTDARFAPAVIAQVYRSGNLPAEALPLVTNVAITKDSAVELRTQAIVALLKSNQEDALVAAIVGLEQLSLRNVGGEAVNLFKEAGTLNRHAKKLLALAAVEKSSVWTDGGLLLLAEDRKKNRKNGNQDAAEQALATAWSQPARRRQLLAAAQLVNARTHEDLVREGLKDSNPAVAALAEKLADAWKITESAPAGPKVSTLKPDEALVAVLKLKGEAGRGEGIFVKLSCNKCHTVKPDEPIRGPYLPNVAKTYKREQLAESILLPSKTIAQGFVTNVFVMNDGKQISGFVISEAADVVTIRNNEGNELKLRVEDIDERAKQTISMMPDNLAKDLTLEELASLLTYLESLASRATAVSPKVP